VAVLGDPSTAGPVACALALRLAAVAGAEAALVVATVTVPGPRAPARPGAARLAGALVARDIEAIAAGRLVRAALGDAGPGDFGRALVAAPGPAVLLAGGRRTEEVDAELEGHDAVVLAPGPDADPVVADLAARRLRALGHRRVTVAAAPADPLTRALAVAGLGATGPLRAAAAAVLEAGS
jgi:hypothetical protein